MLFVAINQMSSVYKGCTIIFKLMFHRCLDLPDFFCFHNVLLIASFVRVIKVRFERQL
jgi:hypothetical protein